MGVSSWLVPHVGDHNWWVHPIPPAPSIPSAPGHVGSAEPTFPEYGKAASSTSHNLVGCEQSKCQGILLAPHSLWHGGSTGTQAEFGLNSAKILNPWKWGRFLCAWGIVVGVRVTQQRWPRGTQALSPQMCSWHEQCELITRCCCCWFDYWNW